MSVFLVVCIFQLESELNEHPPDWYAHLLQPPDTNVVAAAVLQTILHALVSPFLFFHFKNQFFKQRLIPSSSSQLLAASSQYLQPDQPSPTQSSQSDPLSRRPQAGRHGNPEVQMNAQGGEILNEEELNRDWLDWVYTFSRAAILLSIVYFYSSFSRFIMVVMAMLVLYL